MVVRCVHSAAFRRLSGCLRVVIRIGLLRLHQVQPSVDLVNLLLRQLCVQQFSHNQRCLILLLNLELFQQSFILGKQLIDFVAVAALGFELLNHASVKVFLRFIKLFSYR